MATLGADPPGERDEADQHGVDAVRAALGRARAAAAAKGLRPGRPGRQAGRQVAGRGRRREPGALSGAYPDGRDPQPFGSSVQRLVDELGWSQPVAVGGVMGRWDDIVGPQIAEHCRPVTFDAGLLTVAASSTAWATQLRLLAPRLVARLAEDLGDGVVTRIVVRGPAAPSWRRGLLRVSDGRGPRDTYG